MQLKNCCVLSNIELYSRASLLFYFLNNSLFVYISNDIKEWIIVNVTHSGVNKNVHTLQSFWGVHCSGCSSNVWNYAAHLTGNEAQLVKAWAPGLCRASQIRTWPVLFITTDHLVLCQLTLLFYFILSA